MRHGLVMMEKDGHQRQVDHGAMANYEARGWTVSAEQPPNNAGRDPVVASAKPKRKPRKPPAPKKEDSHPEVRDPEDG